jgi:hypothetical protein
MMMRKRHLAATSALCLALTAAVIFVGSDSIGGDDGTPAHQRYRQKMPELPWAEVGSEEIVPSLEFLSAQTKSNFERITTWESIWDVHNEVYLSPAYVKAHYAGRQTTPSTTGLIQATDKRMKCIIDVHRRNVFRDSDTTAFRHLTTDTREPVDVPQVTPVDERSVVTPSDFVYFNSKYPPSTHSVLPDHPDAQNKRAAHRLSAQQAMERDPGGLMDPQMFYRCSSLQMCWDEATMLANALRGGLGPEQQKLARDGLRVDKAMHEGQTWFRVRVVISASGKIPARLFTSIWSPRTGFYPVSLTLSTGAKPGGEVTEEAEWEWKQVDGIYVPERFSKTVRTAELNGLETYKRVVRLKECVLNRPLSPDAFTFAALGLGKGDLLIDEIEQAVFIIASDGKLQKLAAFRGLAKVNSEHHYLWWVIAVAGLLLISVFFIRLQRAGNLAKARG